MNSNTKTMKFVIDIVTVDGVHTVIVSKVSFFGLVKTEVQRATNTRAQYALTSAFKGLLPKK